MIIISQEVPVYGSLSTTSVMRALVKNIDSGEKIHYLGFRSLGSSKQIEKPNFTFTAIPLPKKGERYFRFILLPFLFAVGIWKLLTQKHKLVLAAFPDDASLLLGLFISTVGGKDFYPYFMDLYTETGVWAKPLDKWLQKRAIEKAKEVVVINEGMQQYYSEHYGLTTFCLPHLFPQKPKDCKIKIKQPKQLIIGYSGTVNGVRIEGLKKLVEVINDIPGVILHYYTPQDRDFLASQGLWNERFQHKNISNMKNLLLGLSSCDLLYNPVYGGGIDTAQVKTSFGSKVVEYIAAGPPILVDSDPNFFTYEFLEKHKVGLRCQHKSVKSIKDYILRLMNDPEFYKRIAESNKNLWDYYGGERAKEFFYRAGYPVEKS